MSRGIMDTIIGGMEAAAGGILIATGIGAPIGAALIVAGAGEIMTGIAQMLEKQPGQGIATTNSVYPWNYIYGTMKVPGAEIFSETNSITQTGATTSNDKQWHRVFALACHPTDSLLEVRLDGQVLNLVQQASSDPNTTIWQSASPSQTTCNVTSISRSGGIVTMKVSGGFAASFNGQTMVVSGVRDNTYNGVWTMWLPNPADLTTWQYQCGGADGSSSGGKCETCLPDYSNKVHVEFQNGNQTHTFPGLLEAQIGSTSPLTWSATDVCYGHTVVYVQMGYDPSYFPSLPTSISFVVKGKNDILDPRSGHRGYTENPILCTADYMAQPRLRGGFGLAIGTSIDQNNMIAAANICDETLALAAGGTVPQYSCNTTFDLNTARGTNIQRMLSACAGRLSVQGGVWSILPGAYVAQSLTLNEKNIIGPIKLDVNLGVVEACNAVKGTFVSAGNNYQPSDYPLYQQDSLHGYATNQWLVEDGNEILVHNLDLPCTNVSAVAQRLAKIQLMRSRYQYRLHLQCDLTAYQAVVADVIGISLARYAWVNEPFEVLHVGLVYDDKGKPSVELDLAQVDGASSAANSAIYSWSPTEELTITDSVTPNNVGVRVCSAPENVVAYSGTGATVNGVVCPSTITTRADGTQANSIYVEWSTPNDANVVKGGHLEIQWQPIGSTNWTSVGQISASANYAWIANVSDDTQYNVQVRAVNAAGVASAWIAATPTPITVGSVASAINPIYIPISRPIGTPAHHVYPVGTQTGVTLDDLMPLEQNAEQTTGKAIDVLVDGTYARPLNGKPNLIPDSDFKFPSTHWNPLGANQAIGHNAARTGGNYFAWLNGGAGWYQQSAVVRNIPVSPSTQYTMTCVIDATAVTSGQSPEFRIITLNASGTILSGFNGAIPQGTVGTAICTFTTDPTAAFVQIWFGADTAWVGNANFLQPMLVRGANAGAYTSSDQSSTAGNIIDFANTNHAGKVLDNISDGSIYARTIASRVSSGKPWIDFSESIHANKTMQYIGDGGGRYAAGESGANVTSAHVLTATATPSANLPLTGSYVAIPSLGWALIAGSTLDVYNVWTHIQINPPIAGENHSYLIRLALCVDGNTSSPIYSSTYNGLVTSNANSFDLYLFASAVGLSPGSHTLQLYAASGSPDPNYNLQMAVTYAICQRIF